MQPPPMASPIHYRVTKLIQLAVNCNIIINSLCLAQEFINFGFLSTASLWTTPALHVLWWPTGDDSEVQVSEFMLLWCCTVCRLRSKPTSLCYPHTAFEDSNHSVRDGQHRARAYIGIVACLDRFCIWNWCLHLPMCTAVVTVQIWSPSTSPPSACWWGSCLCLEDCPWWQVHTWSPHGVGQGVCYRAGRDDAWTNQRHGRRAHQTGINQT